MEFSNINSPKIHVQTVNINTSTYATKTTTHHPPPPTTTTQMEYSVYYVVNVDEKYTTPCTGTV
jgi:hypothetical protein